jgi:HD-GYP domain-containing protein (c-di-GMP phosphodiesterase class II)
VTTERIGQWLLVRRGEGLATLVGDRSRAALLASGEGVEVVRLEVQGGECFGLSPADDFEGLEMLYVTRGEVQAVGRGATRYGPGAFLTAFRAPEPVVLEATCDAELLYVSSRPSFHRFSQAAEELFRLADETEAKDGLTAEHCRRIQRLARLVGERLGLPPARLHVLLYAAYLHDVGKVLVPDEILKKAGPLTEPEWEVMRRHPSEGRRLVEQTFMREAAAIIEEHHERYDGHGYPKGKRGDEISLEAHIIAVVDAYDAMCSPRPYRPALTRAEAMAELRRGRGSQWHPAVVDAFLDLPTEPHS